VNVPKFGADKNHITSFERVYFFITMVALMPRGTYLS
jgi:hypothetical protein